MNSALLGGKSKNIYEKCQYKKTEYLNNGFVSGMSFRRYGHLRANTMIIYLKRT
jgi:hypothetical protein